MAEESPDPREFKLPQNSDNFSAVKIEDYNELPTYPDRPHFHEHHLKMQPATQLVCFDGCPSDPYHPAVMPLYQSATFVQPSVETFGPYDYTRSGNPTRTALETLVAGLEDAHSAFAFTSGMAALNSVVQLVDHGSTILACADLYGGMHRLLTQVTCRSGITPKFVDTSDLNQVKEAIKTTPNIKLIHIETPSNPLMRITDLRGIAKLAHEHGILVSVDSTMMTPYLQKPLECGCDIVIHSATKFLSGHSDTMAGIVGVTNEALAKRLAFIQNATGTALAPFDCWLLLRSIKTLALRVMKAQENAEQVAAFLSRHPAVKKLHYAGSIPNPKRQSSVPWSSNTRRIGMSEDDTVITKVEKVNISMPEPAFRLHMSQSKGGGSVISFETGDVDFSRRLVNACRLFKITVSFGSCNSLIEMPCTQSHASIPKHKRTLPDDLVRISIGIEEISDIIGDLERAFKCAATDVTDVRKIQEGHDELKELPIAEITQAYTKEDAK